MIIRKIINIVMISISVGILIIGGMYYGKRQLEFNNNRKQLTAEISGNKNEIENLRKTVSEKVTVVETKVEGLSQVKRKEDAKAIELFFHDAFDWSSGKSYDNARAKYIDKLGKDHMFVKDFMPENIKVETTDKSLPNNDIDLNDLRSELKSIESYPVNQKADGSVEYISYVTYYNYQDKSDLNNTAGFAKSVAIVDIVVDGATGSRSVKDVNYASMAA